MDKMLSKMDPAKLQKEFAAHIATGAPIPSPGHRTTFEDVPMDQITNGPSGFLEAPAPLQDGEVVVRREELAELRAFARISGYPEGWFSYEIPFGKCMDDWGTDLSYRLKIEREEAQAWLDAQPANGERARDA